MIVFAASYHRRHQLKENLSDWTDRVWDLYDELFAMFENHDITKRDFMYAINHGKLSEFLKIATEKGAAHNLSANTNRQRMTRSAQLALEASKAKIDKDDDDDSDVDVNDGSTGKCACRNCVFPVWPGDNGWCDFCFGNIGGECSCDCAGCADHSESD